MKRFRILMFALLLAAALPTGARAQDRLKLAVGQYGNWATSVAEVGQRGGVFRRHGLELHLLYTQGSGETQQAVLAGGADIGVRGRRDGGAGRLCQGRAGADHRRTRPPAPRTSTGT